MRGVRLPCRCGCVAEFPLQVPQGSFTSTTFCEQLCPLGLKELRALQNMTEGDSLAGDATSNEATALRRIPKVRIDELVAERPSVVSAPSVPAGSLRQGKEIEESRAADEPESRVTKGCNSEVRQGVEPSTGE
eukprot:234236-Pleurochrysis_carterae.AAC.1